MYWAFSGESWATFITTQCGNNSNNREVNQLAINMRNDEDIPHINEEFGVLRSDSDPRLRGNMWANFCGGAAGGGTGSDLKTFMRFLSQTHVPFWRMNEANSLIILDSGSGYSKFCLAEDGHHYVVYTTDGDFTLKVSGSNLTGYWFDPQDPNASLSDAFGVFPGVQTFAPPRLEMVLWITNGSNLGSGLLYPSAGATLTQELIAGQHTAQNHETSRAHQTGADRHYRIVAGRLGPSFHKPR